MFTLRLEGEVVYLNQLKQEELPLLLALYEEKEFMQDYGYAEGLTQTYDELYNWYQGLQKSENEVFYSIFERKTNQWIGFVSLMDLNEIEHEGWLVIGLAKGFRGKGIGEESLNVLLEEAPSKGIKTVKLSVLSHNERAIKLYKKLGFKLEAIYPKNIYPNIFGVDILELGLNLELLKSLQEGGRE